jgi:hypothetical protein
VTDGAALLPLDFMVQLQQQIKEQVQNATSSAMAQLLQREMTEGCTTIKESIKSMKTAESKMDTAGRVIKLTSDSNKLQFNFLAEVSENMNVIKKTLGDHENLTYENIGRAQEAVDNSLNLLNGRMNLIEKVEAFGLGGWSVTT